MPPSIIPPSIMPPSILLFFFGLLSATGSLPPPRTTFLLPSADRPLVLFSLPDIHNTTTLLLSDDGDTLYVGARDAVLSLDVSQSDVISLKKKVEWRPSDSEIKDCENKGKDATVDCPNFVRVLQPMNSTHLYACGSYAYSPHDGFIDAESFSMVDGQQADTKAKVRCPFSPMQKSTAIIVDGELFTATTTNFRGVEPQISRHFSKDGRQDVSQDSSLLEEPRFVSSASDPSEGKLYFFFNEVGNEFSFVDKLRIARVAQVCKDDVGGQRTLQNKWTSFAKTSLLCQVPKHLPFNVLRDVFTLPPPEGSDAANTLFYGVFTSQWSSGPESSVCVFKLQDIRAVFTGTYMNFDFQNQQWSTVLGKHPYLGQCGLNSASDSELEQVKKSFMTSGKVKPVGGGPVVVSSGQQYSHVAALRTQAANGNPYTVLFLLTESGFLHKVVLLDQGVHVVEEIQVFSQPQLVKSIVLSSSKGVVYVGTSEGVTAVPVARCSGYRTCSQCVLARDPLCGWSRSAGVCTALVAQQQDMAQDLENGNVEEQCPGQTRNSLLPATEVSVHLNEVVRLQCRKPSNVAALTWTSSRSDSLPDKLFIRSADGSLSFLATHETFGTYRCEAEEGGYRETVASYEVQQIVPPQIASPRSFSPFPKAEDDHGTDEPFEEISISTEEPKTSTTKPSGEPEDSGMKDEGVPGTTDWSDASPTDLTDEIVVADKANSGLKNEIKVTPERDAWSGEEPADERLRVREKSFYSELVVVSLLLAACVCVLILAGIHVWRQRKTGLKKISLVGSEDGGKTNQSMETVPSLSSPEDTGGPEVKVE
ncbi:hypothetical protein EPR50_G00058380 [Perca flavescens]|uniref:Sema domain-containing protein n=1 Tax=Perca flavescens TaxID=8167 RepID=A0A484D7D9_PERFV|nr:semaphorin-4A-like isoform X2 [Perca flavescens]TDH11203.1 hypothetical protein EPR50_G00058380 [Perca flavescens]